MVLEDSDRMKWVCHEQTEIKHKILKAYLNAWLPMLGSWNDRLVVVDGFAGRGSYISRDRTSDDDDAVDGSPLLMLKTLLDHKGFTKGHLNQLRDFIFLFIEANTDNFNSLQRKIEVFKNTKQPWPQNVKTIVKHNEFRDIAINGIDEYVLQRPSDTKQATFVFVDPFGFTGFTMALLHQICHPSPMHSVELFLNFMGDFVLRYGVEDELKMSQLFGVKKDEWRTMRAQICNGGNNPKECLRDTFRDRLQTGANFDYVWPVEMNREDGSFIYYLMYGTRHPAGLDRMKSAISKVKEDTADESRQDSGTIAKLLKDYLMEQPRGVKSTIEEIETYVVTKTNFRKSQTKNALKLLETKGQISVTERKKRFTYPPASRIAASRQSTIPTLFSQSRE
jgi:three-Cys-motif partner protein